MSTLIKIGKGERPVFTAGEQIWDYLFSKDAARALYLLGATESAKGIYCLGSGNPQPLKEYICAIRDAVDADAEIGLGEVPYAKNQVMYLCADISKLTTDTGFVPQTDFAEGIRKTAQWYKSENE